MSGYGDRYSDPLDSAFSEEPAATPISREPPYFAGLNKEQINKVAQMAQDGLARAVRPAHTMQDGDTIFALSTGDKKADVNIVGAFAAEVFAQAIVRAVKSARPAGGLPAWSDLQGDKQEKLVQ